MNLDFDHEDEIWAAKALLHGELSKLTSDELPRLVHRKGDNRARLDVDDLFTLLAHADELNVCSQLPTFVAAVPDKMPYIEPGDLMDMCTVMNKVMQLESLLMYHDSVIKKCESTLSAAEHSPMQKNQPEQGVDSG